MGDSEKILRQTLIEVLPPGKQTAAKMNILLSNLAISGEISGTVYLSPEEKS